MIIKWFGHSCFLLTSDNGTNILTDPVDPETGYNIEPMEVDAVTSSHSHHDHTYFALAQGTPQKITAPGNYIINDVTVTGVSTYHDSSFGKERGENIVFVFEIDGVRIAHAGDLGQIPSPDAIAKIGRVDVLLTPIGGVYTISGDEARELANILNPRVVIPMHYNTEALRFDLDELSPFLNSVQGCAIHRMRQNECHISSDSLGACRVVVLDYEVTSDEN